MTGAQIVDTAGQRAREWLHDIGHGLGFDNEHTAHAALRATLHALRDRLPVELVAHFGAGLPTLIRGIYYDGWHPSGTRLRAAHDEDFATAIRRELHGHRELGDAEQAALAVMGVMAERMEAGQIAHIVKALPRDVRALWQIARE